MQLINIWFRYTIKLVMTMKFDTNKHSVFLLYYHLILVTKYRRDVIDERISRRLKEIFEYIHCKLLHSFGKEKK